MSMAWSFLANSDVDTGKVVSALIVGAIVLAKWAIGSLRQGGEKTAERERQLRARMKQRIAAAPPPVPRALVNGGGAPRAQEEAITAAAGQRRSSERRASEARVNEGRANEGRASEGRSVLRKADKLRGLIQPKRRPAPPSLPAPGKTSGQYAAKPAAPEVASNSVSINQPLEYPEPQIASAADLRRWLNPATLKQQYILTELLAPPLALRPPREL